MAVFKEGRALLDAGRYAEAAARFKAANELRATAGTRLSLGDAYEKAGKLASASSAFQEAGRLARKAQDPGREGEAKRRGGLLEPRLSRWSSRSPPPTEGPRWSSRKTGSRSRGRSDTPIPLDAEVHTIEASGPGKQTWKTTITVEPSPGVMTVQVPALAQAPALQAAPS